MSTGSSFCSIFLILFLFWSNIATKYVFKFLSGCIKFFKCYKAFCLCDRKATHVSISCQCHVTILVMVVTCQCCSHCHGHGHKLKKTYRTVDVQYGGVVMKVWDFFLSMVNKVMWFGVWKELRRIWSCFLLLVARSSPPSPPPPPPPPPRKVHNDEKRLKWH